MVLTVLVMCRLPRWGHWVLLNTRSHEFNIGNSKDLAFIFSSCIIASDRVGLKEKKEVNPFHFITGD